MNLFQLPDPEFLKKVDFKNPATWVATWFGCGLMRPAPGTWGTLGGLPVGLILLTLGGQSALAAGIFLVFIMGMWSAKQFAAMTGTVLARVGDGSYLAPPGISALPVRRRR